jgi:hypothetical protein
MPFKHEIKEQKKTAILGTTHIQQNVLMEKYKTFNIGNNITWTIYCNYRAAAILYILETWFDSGM